ncbi:hypothetical protein EFN45_03065 [Leuconostoc citreum]|uniref:hypothetical protein n=1 Tax=Leuconostoc citreum TaxID=33964 RepID=UPI0021A2743E|nr:hypothetical protein [Leuconostoc citreum]MCT3069081.1 hypothetical protein [Leuconostoc citreum]
MAIKSDFGNEINGDLRNGLNQNFEEIKQALDSDCTNIDGKTFATLNDRLDAIEWGLKALGMPIDGSAKDWLGEQ